MRISKRGLVRDRGGGINKNFLTSGRKASSSLSSPPTIKLCGDLADVDDDVGSLLLLLDTS